MIKTRVDLFVDRTRSACGQCGRGADVTETHHLTVVEYKDPGEAQGCGAEFTHIVPVAYSAGIYARLYEMRPDLIVARLDVPDPKPQMPASGIVYFIQHETGGLIKIGTTNHPPGHRLLAINAQTHDPRYRILATEPGGRTRESELHSQFAHLRKHGEWFDASRDLLDHIKVLADA